MQRHINTLDCSIYYDCWIKYCTWKQSGIRHDDKSERQNRNFTRALRIKEGDTLWEIAKEYRGDDYDSIYDYIDEVMSINGLTSDQIHAGQCLTVAYYDTQAR